MRFWRHWLVVALVIACGLLFLLFVCSAPLKFRPATIAVTKGDSVALIARELRDADVLVATLPLRLLLRVSGGDGQMHAGVYRFNTPENVFVIARRLLTAEYGLPSARITFPEGYTSFDMAREVHEALPSISEAEFLALAKPEEGYLFPDTYDFSGSVTAASIIKTLRDTFKSKTASLAATGAAHTHTLAEIVIVASLVEKEARTDENRRLVAGVLWNRVDRDMPLQVDAVFGYIFSRDTYSPSAADLKVDSPYNTYTQKGLPPGPINNPGLAALKAAANPTKTPYLYYLTGSDNEMHYATTYAGHQANLLKYLK